MEEGEFSAWPKRHGKDGHKRGSGNMAERGSGNDKFFEDSSFSFLIATKLRTTKWSKIGEGESAI